MVFEAYNNYHLAKVGLDDIKILGANISTGMTRPVSDKTSPVVSVTPGINPTTTTAEFSTPSPTINEATTTKEEQVHSSFETSSTTPSYTGSKTEPTKKPDKSTSEIPNAVTTEKGGKKTTVKPTKNPIKANDKENEAEKQSGQDDKKYGSTSMIVGVVVGVLLVLILVVVIVYTIVDQKNRPKTVRPKQDKMADKHHQHSNGKVSNGGLDSDVYLDVQVSEGRKPASNGTVKNTYDNPAISCQNQVYSIQEHGKQSNGNLYPNNDLQVLTSDNTEFGERL